MKSQLNPGHYRATNGTRPDDRNSVRFAVSLTERQYEGVRLYAESQGMPLASAMRQLALLAPEALGARQ